ncbi:hypothetical protein MKW94_010262 [Papaver nudicaule]|uniref:UBC core domain-containing protein n=1 Tax=Papaver nudicaule TaxID=74823 RepID=A0AA41VX43_PAPNU|nr:hypothetical protein [Papaver nudicaule]
MEQELTEIRVEGGREEQNQQQHSNSTVRREEEFKHFDIISTENDIEDHHYFSSSASLSPTGNAKIMKEWRVLDRNLPDSIYVRAYEGRIDLLRAVIIGPAGTPYHDGLFFFDIKFPSDYPDSPPKVCYRSFGHRLNPNLYKNGYVCLSLINTWSGDENEKWKPSQSTILQVLVSIQGLVLNAKPYFNEPAFAKMPKNSAPWKGNSLSYNRNAFILSCKTMLCILRRPPRFFEEMVVQHFRDRAEAILTACNAYITGQANIGDQPITTNGGRRTRRRNSRSRTFKASMGSVYAELIKSFKENGASLENFEILDTSKTFMDRLCCLSNKVSMCGLCIWLLLLVLMALCFAIIVSSCIWLFRREI